MKKIYYSIASALLITGALLLSVLSHTGNKIVIIRVILGIIFILMSILMFRNGVKSKK